MALNDSLEQGSLLRIDADYRAPRGGDGALGAAGVLDRARLE